MSSTESSTTHSANSKPNWKQRTIKYLDRQARIKLWLNEVAARHLIDDARQQHNNIRAEDAGARKAMGWPEPSDIDTSDKDMDPQTIIGDVTQAPPVIVMSGNGGNSLGAIVLAGLLGAAIPGAGVAGALLSKWLEKPQVKSQVVEPKQSTFEDQTVELGLRKLNEDETTDNEQ